MKYKISSKPIIKPFMDRYKWFMNEFKALENVDLTLYKELQMQRRIEAFIIKNIGRLDYTHFVDEITINQQLKDAFLEHITINVTEFFRNYEIWDIVEKKILPDIISKQKKEIKIWSAGCSSGEEPYTIAMILLANYPQLKVTILATDIDKVVLKKAKEGIYNISTMKNLPSSFKYNYFKKIQETPTLKNRYQICDDIKELVEFRRHDMLLEKLPSDIDLIICRNVVIYFKEETKERLYKSFYNSLNENGYLFVGNTEHILNYKDIGFKNIESFFFKK